MHRPSNAAGVSPRAASAGCETRTMITTHVLDTSKGGPAVGMTVILEVRQASEWLPVNRGVTDEKGRLSTLTEHWTVSPGTYRLVFDVGDYHRWNGITSPF